MISARWERVTTDRSYVQAGWILPIAIGVVYFFASEPIYPLVMKGPSEWVLDVPGLGDARLRVWAVLYAAILLLLLASRRWLIRSLQNQHWLMAALAYFGASCMWASLPHESIIGITQYALTVLFGVVIGTRIGALGILRVVFVAATCAVVGTFAFVVLLPEYAFSFRYNTGALRGIYVEKNHLASFLSYGLCAAVFLSMISRRNVGLYVITAAIAVLVLLSISSIALINLVMILSIAASFFVLRRDARRRIAVLIVVAIVSAALIGLLPSTLSALGEDITLNGRTTLWEQLWSFIVQRPLLGYGYRGFWSTPDADALRTMLGWNATGAHNAWLQTLLYGGVFGLLLWVLQWSKVVGLTVYSLGYSTDLARVGVAALTVAFLLWSLFESNQLAHFTHHAILVGLLFSVRSPGFR